MKYRKGMRFMMLVLIVSNLSIGTYTLLHDGFNGWVFSNYLAVGFCFVLHTVMHKVDAICKEFATTAIQANVLLEEVYKRNLEKTKEISQLKKQIAKLEKP